MPDFTIKQIFIDNWDRFVLENPQLNIRHVVFKEVERMTNCGNPELGYALYYCEHWTNLCMYLLLLMVGIS